MRLRRRELDGVGYQLVEHLQDAFFVGKNLHLRSVNAEVDVSLAGRRVGHVGGAAQQVSGLDRLAIEGQLALFHAVEVENVVDQPHQPVAVADGHIDHLALLFRALVESAGGDESQRGAQRGERGAQFVAYGGDELVFHLLQAAALGDVLEGYDHAGDLAILNERVGAVLDWKRSAVAAPENLVAHADGLAATQGLENGTGGPGIGCAVGVAVVDDLVDVAAGQFIGGVAQGARRRPG